MSERKVLTKYYPPDFDPSQIKRVRGPKTAGPKVQTVRLAAPLFNARKETPPDEKYLGIQIFRFYIRCTRCSAQIAFKTDPKNQDYACESGAKRNTEPWRVGREETDEERLDRLEREEEERNAMVELEAKTVDAKREMAVADALDEIRTRNARLERANQEGVEVGVAMPMDTEAERQEREDAKAARRAFEFARQVDNMMEVIDDGDDATATPTSSSPAPEAGSGSRSTPKPEPARAPAATTSTVSTDMPPPSFKRVVKKKKDHAAALGIKKKPSLV
ncbi:Pre-mRNA-splicing factor cwf16 [Parahypoxylon ruwenzoriense]